MPFLETVQHQLSAQSSLPQLALTLSVLQDLRTLLRTPEQQALFARWCVEQGYLEEDFAPEKYVPKYKVIRILKQAKSAT